MALSEQEQRLLDEMERHLYQNEADVMSTTPRSSASISTRSVVLAILAVAVGLGVVIAGLAVQHPVISPIIGVSGFVVMLLGVLLAFRGRRGAASNDANLGAGPSPKRESPGAGSSSSGFMDRLEDRWDRRRSD